MLSDLGVTRAVRLERRLISRRACEAEKRDSEVRFPARPSLRELEVPPPSLHFTSVVCSFISRLSNAVRPCLPPPAASAPPPHAIVLLCHPAPHCRCAPGRWSRLKTRTAHRREADFSLGAQLPAPTAPPTRRVNVHHFRGYIYVPEFEICAIRPARCVL